VLLPRVLLPRVLLPRVLLPRVLLPRDELPREDPDDRLREEPPLLRPLDRRAPAPPLRLVPPDRLLPPERLPDRLPPERLPPRPRPEVLSSSDERLDRPDRLEPLDLLPCDLPPLDCAICRLPGTSTASLRRRCGAPCTKWCNGCAIKMARFACAASSAAPRPRSTPAPRSLAA
jgi:hypothetical protein